MAGWNVARASGIGATACLIALILWPFYRRLGTVGMWPFACLAVVAGLCGLSILALTAADIAFRRRGARVRPLRGFDLVVGAALVVVSILQLQDVEGQLSV
jgi:hypothetical protein